MRPSFLIVGSLASLLFVTTPAFGLQSEYRALRNQLNQNEPLDTGVIKDLPNPSTAEEYWLRSFGRTNLSRALQDVKVAIRQTDDNPSRYVKTWLDLALLDDPTLERLKYLRGVVRQHAESIRPAIWLRAGKYAGSLEKYDIAGRWTRRALEAPEYRSEARLDLAEYELSSDNPERAERYLDRYLMNRTGRTRARYWMLRGRLFRGTNSDSEAYVAYSHLVRNYPETPLLERAEAELRDLPLPDAFKPKTGEVETSQSFETMNSKSSTQDVRSGEDGTVGGWLIQLASFQQRSRAKRYRRRMESTVSGNLMINSVRIDGSLYYRVQLTGFATKREARRRQQQLERDGIDSFILDGSHQ